MSRLLSGGDLQRVFTQGHGIPFTHAVLPGPSVAYWACKGDLLDISWETVQTAVDQGTRIVRRWYYVMARDLKGAAIVFIVGANEKLRIPFHRISVTMEESTTPSTGFLPDSRSGYMLRSEETQSLTSVPYGTIMNDQGSVSGNTILQQPLRWVVPNADSAVAATFVAVLHPPVVVSEQVAKQLAALSNQAGLNTTMGFHKDLGYLSLQELLVRIDYVVIHLAMERLLKNDSDKELSSFLICAQIKQSIEQSEWEVVLDHGPGAVRQLYSFDRTKNEARLLHRIPFTHVSQIYVCTKVSRGVDCAKRSESKSRHINRYSLFPSRRRFCVSKWYLIPSFKVASKRLQRPMIQQSDSRLCCPAKTLQRKFRS